MFLHFLVSSWLGRVPRPVALSHGPFQQAQILGGAPLVLRSRFLEHLFLSLVVSRSCCLFVVWSNIFLLVSVHVVSNILLIIIFSGRSPFCSSFKGSWTFFLVENIDQLNIFCFMHHFEAYFFHDVFNLYSVSILIIMKNESFSHWVTF